MRLDRIGSKPGAIYRLRDDLEGADSALESHVEGQISNVADDLTAYMACSHANEVKNFPAMCGMDIDLVANNQWWDSIGTPSTAATMVDVAGESITENYAFCLKCVADATTEGLYQRFTYADEPRIKSGLKLSAIAAVWVVTADRTVTMSLTTSASTTVTATATAAAWTLLKCENLTLDGAYVDLKFTINGAGTFYVVPLGVNIGAKALLLRPRGLLLQVMASETSAENLTSSTGKARANVSLKSVTHNNAAQVRLNTFMQGNTNGMLYGYHIYPAGAAFYSGGSGLESCRTSCTEDTNAEIACSQRTLLLDDAQNISTELLKWAGSTGVTVCRLYINDYWIWE